MPEISHVHLAVPDLTTLNRVIREGGAQSFPQWLSTDYGDRAQIEWYGMRGALMLNVEPPDDPARKGLWPRPVDDWTEPPRGVILATVDAARAATDLAPVIGAEAAWWETGEDPLLKATCRRTTLGRSVLVLAEPTGEGYVAACLARFGEGPVAVVLDGTTRVGRAQDANPVSDGPARYVRLGAPDAPTLIFLPASA
ncbi:MAG TPA: hypothetical protein VGO32_04025 [Candidatus Limnocylindria bacterium]|jgi:hypothetical protein|nr:hypothetical protein [Candidatus Limnocylindria bacterium]